MSRNAAGLLILYGNPVNRSDIDDIFSGALTANKEPNMPRTDSFVKGLRTCHVRTTVLSSQHFLKAFGKTFQHGKPARRAAFALNKLATPIVKRARVLKPICEKSLNKNFEHDVHMSPRIKLQSKQTNKYCQMI